MSRIYRVTLGSTSVKLIGETTILYPGVTVDISEVVYTRNRTIFERARCRKIEIVTVSYTGNLTVPSFENRIYYNPATLVAAATITLPSLPVDGKEVEVFFGGTLGTGEPCVTALTFSGPGTNGVLGTVPSYAISGMKVKFVYNSALNYWFVSEITGDTCKLTTSYTSTGNNTIDAFTRYYYYNPASLQSAATLTLPNKLYDGQDLTINFGGTIASGGTVVTTLTITAASPATGIIGVVPTAGVSGVPLRLRYNSTIGKWFVQ